MRPPGRAPRSGAAPAGGFDPLQAELLQEKAANLGRLASRAEAALAALRAHDAVVARAGPGESAAVGSKQTGAPGSRQTAVVGSKQTGAPGSTFEPSPGDAERRHGLLADACEALFLYVVQREVTGLRGTGAVLDEMGVPREVRLRMAPRSVLRGR